MKENLLERCGQCNVHVIFPFECHARLHKNYFPAPNEPNYVITLHNTFMS